MKTKTSLLIAFILCLTIDLQAQTPAQKNYIKTALKDGFNKTAAFTETKGCVTIGKTYGYRSKGLQEGIIGKLKQLNNDQYTIDEIRISPKGKWVIIYNKRRNVSYSKGVPEALKEELSRAKKAGNTFSFVAFNDNEEWICQTTTADKKNVNKSSAKFRDYLSGMIEAAMTNKGQVIIYNGKVNYWGTVPNTLKNLISKYMKSNSNPDGFQINAITFTDLGNAFIGDRNGRYMYTFVD